VKIGMKKTIEVEAKEVEIHAKVRDAGFYTIFDQHGEKLAEYDGYVPPWIPGEYGDYLILRIDLDTGQIVNWKRPEAEQIQDTIEAAQGRGE